MWSSITWNPGISRRMLFRSTSGVSNGYLIGLLFMTLLVVAVHNPFVVSQDDDRDPVGDGTGTEDDGTRTDGGDEGKPEDANVDGKADEGDGGQTDDGHVRGETGEGAEDNPEDGGTDKEDGGETAEGETDGGGEGEIEEENTEEDTDVGGTEGEKAGEEIDGGETEGKTEEKPDGHEDETEERNHANDGRKCGDSGCIRIHLDRDNLPEALLEIISEWEISQDVNNEDYLKNHFKNEGKSAIVNVLKGAFYADLLCQLMKEQRHAVDFRALFLYAAIFNNDEFDSFLPEVLPAIVPEKIRQERDKMIETFKGVIDRRMINDLVLDEDSFTEFIKINCTTPTDCQICPKDRFMSVMIRANLELEWNRLRPCIHPISPLTSTSETESETVIHLPESLNKDLAKKIRDFAEGWSITIPRQEPEGDIEETQGQTGETDYDYYGDDILKKQAEVCPCRSGQVPDISFLQDLQGPDLRQAVENMIKLRTYTRFVCLMSKNRCGDDGRQRMESSDDLNEDRMDGDGGQRRSGHEFGGTGGREDGQERTGEDGGEAGQDQAEEEPQSRSRRTTAPRGGSGGRGGGGGGAASGGPGRSKRQTELSDEEVEHNAGESFCNMHSMNPCSLINRLGFYGVLMFATGELPVDDTDNANEPENFDDFMFKLIISIMEHGALNMGDGTHSGGGADEQPGVDPSLRDERPADTEHTDADTSGGMLSSDVDFDFGRVIKEFRDGLPDFPQALQTVTETDADLRPALFNDMFDIRCEDPKESCKCKICAKEFPAILEYEEEGSDVVKEAIANAVLVISKTCKVRRFPEDGVDGPRVHGGDEEEEREEEEGGRGKEDGAASGGGTGGDSSGRTSGTGQSGGQDGAASGGGTGQSGGQDGAASGGGGTGQSDDGPAPTVTCTDLTHTNSSVNIPCPAVANFGRNALTVRYKFFCRGSRDDEAVDCQTTIRQQGRRCQVTLHKMEGGDNRIVVKAYQHDMEATCEFTYTREQGRVTIPFQLEMRLDEEYLEGYADVDSEVAKPIVNRIIAAFDDVLGDENLEEGTYIGSKVQRLNDGSVIAGVISTLSVPDHHGNVEQAYASGKEKLVIVLTDATVTEWNDGEGRTTFGDLLIFSNSQVEVIDNLFYDVRFMIEVIRQQSRGRGGRQSSEADPLQALRNKINSFDTIADDHTWVAQTVVKTTEGLVVIIRYYYPFGSSVTEDQIRDFFLRDTALRLLTDHFSYIEDSIVVTSPIYAEECSAVKDKYRVWRNLQLQLAITGVEEFKEAATKCSNPGAVILNAFSQKSDKSFTQAFGAASPEWSASTNIMTIPVEYKLPENLAGNVVVVPTCGDRLIYDGDGICTAEFKFIAPFPQIESAQFTDDGKKINIGLSSPIILLYSDDCSNLITNLDCDQAKCRVKRGEGQKAVLEVFVAPCRNLQSEGLELRFDYSAFESQIHDNIDAPTPPVPMPVQPPANTPEAKVVIIGGSRKVPSCSADDEITYRAMIRDASRIFPKQCAWSISSSEDEEVGKRVIFAKDEDTDGDVCGVQIIHKTDLHEDTPYIIQLIVTVNGVPSTPSTIEIEIDSEDKPTLEISGVGEDNQVRPDQPFRLVAEAKFAQGSECGSSNPLVFEWTCTDIDLSGVTTDKRSLQIKKKDQLLPAEDGKVITCTVTATRSGDDSQQVEDSIEVTIKLGPMITRIEGPSITGVNNPASTLSCAGSEDPNDPDNPPTCTWSCKEMQKEDCPLSVFEGEVTMFDSTVPGRYVIILVVSKEGRQSQETEHHVEVTPGEAPEVSFETLPGRGNRDCLPRNREILLAANVTTFSGSGQPPEVSLNYLNGDEIFVMDIVAVEGEDNKFKIKQLLREGVSIVELKVVDGQTEITSRFEANLCPPGVIACTADAGDADYTVGEPMEIVIDCQFDDETARPASFDVFVRYPTENEEQKQMRLHKQTQETVFTVNPRPISDVENVQIVIRVTDKKGGRSDDIIIYKNYKDSDLPIDELVEKISTGIDDLMNTGDSAEAIARSVTVRDAIQSETDDGASGSRRKKRNINYDALWGTTEAIVASILGEAETFTPTECDLTLASLALINLQSASQTYKESVMQTIDQMLDTKLEDGESALDKATADDIFEQVVSAGGDWETRVKIMQAAAKDDWNGEFQEFMADNVCYNIRTTSLDQTISLCDSSGVTFTCGGECSAKYGSGNAFSDMQVISTVGAPSECPPAFMEPVDLTIYDKGGVMKSVSNLEQKAYLTFADPPPICLTEGNCACVTCDKATGKFSGVGITTEVIDGATIVCGTSHLSEFNLYSTNATLVGADEGTVIDIEGIDDDDDVTGDGGEGGDGDGDDDGDVEIPDGIVNTVVGLGIGIIVGIIVGVVALIVIIIILIVVMMKVAAKKKVHSETC